MALPSTQAHLDIAEIKNDSIVLKDGTLRAVLLVSSINFALKSEDEQNALIAAYVRFLNSLEEYPVQIVIQSRKLNIQPYLDGLKERQKTQTNELLRIQTADYITYVEELVELGDIMDRKFYVVVPFVPWKGKQKSFWTRLIETLSAAAMIRLERRRFEKYREELFKRADEVISGLSAMGLKVAPLDTQSLIELFYNCYNPITSQNQKMEKVEKLRVE
jgi:hypothetical protein